MAITGVPNWLPGLLSCLQCGTTPLAMDGGRGLIHCHACGTALPVDADVVWVGRGTKTRR